MAEKAGIIRFYDTKSGAAVMFFECNRSPLMSSDWCNNNSFYIGCCAGKDLFFWDTSMTSLPIRVVKTNSDGLSDFAFYDNAVVAYRGRPNNFVKVHNVNTNQVSTFALTIFCKFSDNCYLYRSSSRRSL